MSTTTSDTPRTDRAVFTCGECGPQVSVDFAQKLERELAQAKAYSQQVVVNITEEMNGLKEGMRNIEMDVLRDAAFKAMFPDKDGKGRRWEGGRGWVEET